MNAQDLAAKSRRRPEVLYMAVTNDKYELPLCVCENVTGLSHRLGIEPRKIQKALLESPSGVIIPRMGGVKYFRINSRTGETIVGGIKKLPPS